MLDEKDLQYLAEMEKRIDARMTEMADEARRGAVHDMQVIIENTIMPSLKLLAEGQRTLLETMAPKTRVEELEDDMQLLKAVVRSQSERIDALEKRSRRSCRRCRLKARARLRPCTARAGCGTRGYTPAPARPPALLRCGRVWPGRPGESRSECRAFHQDKCAPVS